MFKVMKSLEMKVLGGGYNIPLTIALGFVIVYFVGCASSPKPTTVNAPTVDATFVWQQSESPAPPSYSPWQTKTEIERYSKGEFQLDNLSTTVIGDNRIRISGMVKKCSYPVKKFKVRTKTFYQIYAKTFGKEWRKIEEEEVTDVVRYNSNWMPKRLYFSSPVTESTYADVAQSGYFETTLTTSKTYLAAKPPQHNNKYYSIYSYNKPKQLSILPDNPPESIKFGEHKLPIPVWFYDIKWETVTQYVTSCLTKVELTIADKITHLPVSPKMVIQGINVPDLLTEFEKEFKDPEITARALRELPGHLKQAEKFETHGQSLTFVGVAGAMYKIESMHPNYYYFTANIVLPREELIQKKVLLVEKGSKIRQENVREGEGGDLIDAN